MTRPSSLTNTATDRVWQNTVRYTYDKFRRRIYWNDSLQSHYNV
jgi:hypothetical protein